MKRCGRSERIYQIRVTYKRTKRKFRSKRKKEKQKSNTASYDHIIKAPIKLILNDENHRHNVLDFIEDINFFCRLKNKRILLDFSRTTHMYSGATLLFRAHICRIYNKKHISTTIKCKYSKVPKINEVLKQIGLLEILGQKLNRTPRHPDVVHWRYAQGAGALGEKYEEILGSYDGAITPALSEGLYLGITEAMTNTRHHAYPDQENSSYNEIPTNEWWMFSQEKDGELHVVICDLGIGIPVSLPTKKPNVWKKITSKLGGTPKDSIVIQEAIRHSKTRTGKEHRGKGLKQLTNVLANTKGGRLVLFSNHGCYNVREGDVSLFDFKRSINGTLIAWSLPIANLETAA